MKTKDIIGKILDSKKLTAKVYIDTLESLLKRFDTSVSVPKTKHTINRLYATLSPPPKKSGIPYTRVLEAKDYDVIATGDLAKAIKDFDIKEVVTKFYKSNDPKLTKKQQQAFSTYIRRIKELKKVVPKVLKPSHTKSAADNIQPREAVSIYGPRGSEKSKYFGEIYGPSDTFDSSKEIKEEEFFSGFENLMAKNSLGKYEPTQAARDKYREYVDAINAALEKGGKKKVYIFQNLGDALGAHRSESRVYGLKDPESLPRAIARARFPEETERALADYIEQSELQSAPISKNVTVFTRGQPISSVGLPDLVKKALTDWSNGQHETVV
jgi:hypothetical protein